MHYSTLIRNKLLPGLVLILLLSVLPFQPAQAVPAFARQINAECSVCHYQHFPKLNAFGRSFKAGGYSMINDEPLAGDNLSFPPNLNLTFFMRNRFVDASDGNGTWEVPDEASILAGGRLAEGAGGIVEWGGPLLSAKIVMSKDLDLLQLGTTIFTTDGLGAGYGFELMNTGAVRNLRGFERANKALTGNNASLEVAGAATGLAFYAAGSEWFTAVTWFVPDSKKAGQSQMDAGSDLSWYLRAAWLPNVAGQDFGIGFGRYGGQTEVTTVDTGGGLDAFGNTPGRYKLATNAAFVDAQYQGSIASHSLGLYLIHARGDKDEGLADTVNLWSGVGDRPESTGMDMEIELVKDLHLLMTAGSYDDGSPALSPKTLRGLGLYWKIHQNVTLQPMVEVYGGDQGVDAKGDEITRYTLTLETAF